MANSTARAQTRRLPTDPFSASPPTEPSRTSTPLVQRAALIPEQVLPLRLTVTFTERQPAAELVRTGYCFASAPRESTQCFTIFWEALTVQALRRLPSRVLTVISTARQAALQEFSRLRFTSTPSRAPSPRSTSLA